MKLDVIISADNIKEEYLENKIVVVIDMLRATSVIITALKNKARVEAKNAPVASTAEAPAESTEA